MIGGDEMLDTTKRAEIINHSSELNAEIQAKSPNHFRILPQNDLNTIFPFGKEKVLKLLNSGELPVVKIGKDYITTFKLLEKWIEEHVGEEIYY